MNSQHRAGLALLGLLAVSDLSTPFVTEDGQPPMWVAVLAAGLGLATLALLPGAWRGRPSAVFAVVGTRVVSALLALPAFFVDDVPGGVLAIVTVTVALTVVGAVLVLVGARRLVTA
jgi:hypothetical protein